MTARLRDRQGRTLVVSGLTREAFVWLVIAMSRYGVQAEAIT